MLKLAVEATALRRAGVQWRFWPGFHFGGATGVATLSSGEGAHI